MTIEEANEDLTNVKQEYKKAMMNLDSNKATFKFWTKSCFVVFNTISDCEKFYDNFNHKLYNRFYLQLKKIFSCCCKTKSQGKSLDWVNTFKVERAPEPEDVYWENFIYSDNQRFCRQTATLCITFLLTVINFGVILALNYADVLNYYINFM